MKKLLAVALALGMLLAAVPTLAATGWDKPQPTPQNYDDFEMTANKYEWYSASTGGYGINGNYFPNWNDNNGIVRDTLGRVYFTVKLPKAGDAAALYPGVSFSNLTVKITITNVKAVRMVDLNASAVDYYPNLSNEGINSNNVYTATASGSLSDVAQLLKYMYVFRAADAANVVASISISAGAVSLPATFLYRNVQVTADTSSSSTYDWVFSASTGQQMLFDTDASDRITAIFLYDGGTIYQVFTDVNGSIAFKDGQAAIQNGDAGYASLKNTYDFFMGALGFSWDGTAKYMNASLIVKNLVRTASGSSTVTFPGGYQSIVTPTTPGVNPPQTGDATSVVGFALIGLAAAAFVVTRKRARGN